MFVRFVVLVWLLAAASSTPAAPRVKFDCLKVGAKTYNNVTIMGVNVTDLYFTHDHGIANVKLRNLDVSLQKQFNYDPKAAAEAERQQEEEDLAFQRNALSNMVFQAQKAIRAAQKAAKSSDENLADPISEKSLLGKPAPKIEVEKWINQKPMLNGKCALICFWAPWSIPCKRWIPQLNALQSRYAEKLAVVGITSEPETDVKEMLDPPIEFASGVDTKSKLSGEAGVTSVPYVVLVDNAGLVRYQGHPGALDERRLQSLLAKIPDP
jgi:thiol-disulfide isomerase/thioredoxin